MIPQEWAGRHLLNLQVGLQSAFSLDCLEESRSHLLTEAPIACSPLTRSSTFAPWSSRMVCAGKSVTSTFVSRYQSRGLGFTNVSCRLGHHVRTPGVLVRPASDLDAGPVRVARRR